MIAIELDVWVRGTVNAVTQHLDHVDVPPAHWSDDNVRQLLEGMLLALEREKNPEGEPPPVTLRGFSWIVSPYERGGVLLHLEMVMGTVSAGPFAVDEATFTASIRRVMQSPTVH